MRYGKTSWSDPRPGLADRPRTMHVVVVGGPGDARSEHFGLVGGGWCVELVAVRDEVTGDHLAV